MDENPEILSPVLLKAKGGDLKVYLEKTGYEYVNVWLEGPAKVVFEGNIKTGL
jgi:diaminopimelate epimerase